MWPGLIAHHWVEAVNSMELQKDDDHNMLAVMLCAMSEVMIEDLLAQILFHQGGNPKHNEILLDSHWGHNRQIQLFNKLCGQSLKASLNTLGLVSFYDSWEEITKSRNKFVHGTPPGSLFKEFPKKVDLLTVRMQMLEAFCKLHNAWAV